MADDVPTPDWIFWRAVPTVTLSEATALSLNIDPRHFHIRAVSCPEEPGYHHFEWNYPPDQFYPLIELITRCVGKTLPEATPQDAEPREVEDRRVELVQFAAWAKGVGISLPSELSSLAADATRMAWPKGVSTDLRTAVETAISEKGQPGREIAWKLFCDDVRSRCRVGPSARGYGDRSIQRAVKAVAHVRID